MTGVMKQLVAVSLAAVLAAAAFAASAGAKPTGEFAQFAQCEYENPEVTDCLYTVTSGGSIGIGTKTIPLVNPITLEGSYAYEEMWLRGGTNGVTLSKTPQPVPGGIKGVTAPGSWPKAVQEWWNEGIETGLTGVNATIELAGPTKGITNVTLSTENLLFEEGTGLGLPVKIHLENALLGSNCYFGSKAEPIQLDLTTGSSGELTGTPGEISFNGSFTIFTLKGLRLVDETFDVQAVDGCGGIFAEYVDPLVDSIFGTPAAAPENRITFEGKLQDASAEAVFKSGP
ncbi:MAG TPA: hypothetical protein VMS11_13465 [Solirubrobacterales bacterium]|nr:hypothetical protein [Solirubrobacterales bacterium]